MKPIPKSDARAWMALPLIFVALGVVVLLLPCVLALAGAGIYFATKERPADNPPPLAEGPKDDGPKKIDKAKVNPGPGKPKDDPKKDFREPYGQDYFKLPDNNFQWPNRAAAPQIPREQIMPRANEQPGLLSAKSDLWHRLAEQTRANKILKTSIHCGTHGRDPFLELPPEGALLIGFYGDAGDWMGYVQPIFLSADGEKPGRAYGQPKNRVMIVKAKDGYAVGQLYVRAGDLFNGFGVKFMKVKAHGLDVNDSYESEYVGGMGGAGFHLGGDSAFMVGIHGRLITDGAFVPVGNVATLGGVCVKMPTKD
ncbi:MAG: hypothetical protein HY289_09045 [Planctomycetes bacterium]|nr:hypothetical protein [Planctomycetota bacterium]